MISGRFERKRTALELPFCGANRSGASSITERANRGNTVSGSAFCDALREYRGLQALCAGQGRRAIGGLRADSSYRGTGMKCPVQVEGGSPIGSRAKRLGRVQGGSACAVCRAGEPLLRCPEVENLGPGKVDVCVNLYWVLPDAELRRICGFAALPRPGTASRKGESSFETDKAQRALRQAWHLQSPAQ